MASRYTLVLLAALFWMGCDSNDSNDPVTVTRGVITLTSGTQSVSATVTSTIGFVPGAALQADTLRLEPGLMYTGTLELFGSNNENFTETIKGEPDSYLIAYEPLNTKGVDIFVEDRESDYAGNAQGADLRVGLTFDIELSELASIVGTGQLRVTVSEFIETRKTISSISNATPSMELLVPVFIPLVEIEPPPGEN